MRLLPPLLLTLAGLAVAASCSSPTSRVAVSSPVPVPESANPGTPAASVALERETRYYTDEKGAVWDDRGRKMDAKP
jgi:hypothetical protein